MEQPTQPFWNLPANEVVGRLGTTPKGLSSAEALARPGDFQRVLGHETRLAHQQPIASDLHR